MKRTAKLIVSAMVLGMFFAAAAQAAVFDLPAFQSIPTYMAQDWESFQINGETYLAVANSYDDSTYNVDSKIYKWNGTSFVEFQTIATNGAQDWESFKINGETYLAVANSYDDSTYNVDSKIYKWNGTSFVEFQAIATNGARDWESFQINGEAHLLVMQRSTDPMVYSWNGTNFVESQSIPIRGASDCETFEINGETYLAIANGLYIEYGYVTSKIYKSSLDTFLNIDVMINRTSYTTGQTLTIETHTSNGATADNVAKSLWIKLPDGTLSSISLDVVNIPANDDTTILVQTYTFDGSEPAGEYHIGARLTNDITLKELSRDVETFTFVP